jgi:hypothetical protein
MRPIGAPQGEPNITARSGWFQVRGAIVRVNVVAVTA